MIKIASEFNNKYSSYLEEGHYGLDIDDEYTVQYLDKIFEELTKIEGFKYKQIKLKFNSCRFYTNLQEISPFLSKISYDVEKDITQYFKIKDFLDGKNT